MEIRPNDEKVVEFYGVTSISLHEQSHLVIFFAH